MFCLFLLGVDGRKKKMTRPPCYTTTRGDLPKKKTTNPPDGAPPTKGTYGLFGPGPKKSKKTQKNKHIVLQYFKKMTRNYFKP